MSRAFDIKSGKIEYDGSAIFHLNSGRMTNSVSAQQSLHVLTAPCDLYIHSIHYYTDVEFTHASSALSLGTIADPDAFVDAVLLDTQVVGAYEVDMAAATTILRRIPKGSTIAFSLDAADTTGKISATAVLVPYNPA